MAAKMMGVVISVFMINLLTLTVLVEWFELSPTLAQFLALITVAITSFGMQKSYVFNGESHDQ